LGHLQPYNVKYWDSKEELWSPSGGQCSHLMASLLHTWVYDMGCRTTECWDRPSRSVLWGLASHLTAETWRCPMWAYSRSPLSTPLPVFPFHLQSSYFPAVIEIIPSFLMSVLPFFCYNTLVAGEKKHLLSLPSKYYIFWISITTYFKGFSMLTMLIMTVIPWILIFREILWISSLSHKLERSVLINSLGNLNTENLLVIL
jgi:hypothetical protein